jgi:hypothetical protein
MTTQLNDILERVGRIQSDVSEMKVDVAKNTLSLEYHIKRTDLLEGVIEEQRGHCSQQHAPLTVIQVAKVIGATVAAAASIIAIITGIIQIF